MKKILLERSNKAYLPEIGAYIKHFNEKDLGLQLFDSSKLSDYVISDFDCLWKFMGLDVYKKLSIPVIHEYSSLSTGMLPKLKNKVKKSINSKPDLRIYLNKFVKEGMGFHDDIGYVYRDMGVDDIFFQYKDSVKNYDCVYVGAITKARGIPFLLEHFKYCCKSRSLLLVGEVPDEIYKNYSLCDNIIFTGRVPYEEVPKYASQAIYGINYMPNKYPYNLQTSTKLLEYLSMGLKVITTDYPWIKNLIKENDINLITVDENLDNLENFLKKYEGIYEKIPNMEKFKWTNVIEQSGLEEKLLNLIKL